MLVSPVSVGLLQMKRDGVVDSRANASSSEVGLEFIAVLCPDHIQMVDVLAIRGGT